MEAKRLLVLGSTSPTGRLVVQRAIQAGWQVTLYGRRTLEEHTTNPNIQVEICIVLRDLMLIKPGLGIRRSTGRRGHPTKCNSEPECYHLGPWTQRSFCAYGHFCACLQIDPRDYEERRRQSYHCTQYL